MMLRVVVSEAGARVLRKAASGWEERAAFLHPDCALMSCAEFIAAQRRAGDRAPVSIVAEPEARGDAEALFDFLSIGGRASLSLIEHPKARAFA